MERTGLVNKYIAKGYISQDMYVQDKLVMAHLLESSTGVIRSDMGHGFNPTIKQHDVFVDLSEVLLASVKSIYEIKKNRMLNLRHIYFALKDFASENTKNPNVTGQNMAEGFVKHYLANDYNPQFHT